MKNAWAIAVAAASLTACGTATTSSPGTQTPSTSQSASPSTTTTTTPSLSAAQIAARCPAEPSGVDVPTLDPGGFGGAELGMTKAQAAATCLFDVDVKIAEPCPHTIPLQFKEPYAKSMDVYVNDAGRITNMGVWGTNVKLTMSTIGVGSTYGDVQRQFGPSASAPRSAGYDQTGVFVKDGDNYLGFLFNPKPAALKASDTVTFMEIQQGSAPGLMRDGC